MAQMVNQRDKSVNSLLKLWDGHKFSSGSVARDVMLFCVDPHAYSFDATRLTQLDLGLRVAALNVMQHTIAKNRSPRLPERRLDELHNAWEAEKKAAWRCCALPRARQRYRPGPHRRRPALVAGAGIGFRV